MGFFHRLFGGRPRETGPMRVELVPGKLTARVVAHDVFNGSARIPCWVYVTEGLRAVGQKEFVFTLVRDPGSKPLSPPLDPLKFFAQVYTLAEQGQVVDVGGRSAFAPRAGAFLGRTGQVGFAYTHGENVPGVEVPPAGEFLTVIFLVPGEADVVQSIGTYRVLSRLGRAAFYYPTPFWSEASRDPVIDANDLAQSLLGKMPVGYLSGASVRLFLLDSKVPQVVGLGGESRLGDRVTLHIPRSELPRLREIVEKCSTSTEGSFAVSLDADPEANARIAWQVGDGELRTITPSTGDASCLTGGFVAFVAGPSIETGCRLVEDGFAVTVDSETWAKVRHALTAGVPLELPTRSGQLGLTIEWLGTANSDAAPVRDTSGVFHVESMVLYQPDEVLRARVPSVESLARYATSLEQAAVHFWKRLPKGEPQSVLVVAAVRPGGRSRVWVEVPEKGSESHAAELAELLNAVPPPVVQNGPVAVGQRASLWGGAGEWPFVPREWSDVATAAGTSLVVPDEVLERIWPDP